MSDPGDLDDPLLDDPLLDGHFAHAGDGPLGQLPPAGQRRPLRRWRYGPFRALLLVAILLIPTLLEPISRDAVWHAGLQLAHAAAAPGTPNTLPERKKRNQAAPPTPSGAYPPYPLNHAFDAELVPLGGPANAGFETPGWEVGTPPTNAGFDTEPYDTSTQLTNFNFATGTFAGWTATGAATSIQTTGGPEDEWAQMSNAGATLLTDAFTVDPDAQIVTFDIGYLTASGSSSVSVYAMSGATYSTSTLLGSFSCNACNTWAVGTVGVGSFAGQSIKLQFVRGSGTVGLDRVRQRVAADGYAATGFVTRALDGGNPYAKLYDGTLTSGAFTIDGTAQLGSVRLKGLTAGSDQLYIDVLSGSGYGTVTTVVSASLDDSWTTYRFNLAPWLGQSVKLRFRLLTGDAGLDDVGLQRVDLPNWTLGGTSMLVSDGKGGSAAYGGTLTSDPVTLPADVQQVSIRYQVASSGASFYFELLRGPNYGTVVGLYGTVLPGTVGQWETFKAAVNAYAGESVKFRIRPQLGAVTVDDVALFENAVPGWTFGTNSAAVRVAEDAHGTYLTSWTAGGAIQLDSSPIDIGVVDRPNRVDGRSYVVSYAIGNQTGSSIFIDWVPAVGNPVRVYQDAANSPTGFKNGRFTLYDLLGTSGKLWINVTGGGKLYAIADNVARQQLAEPFSQQVRFTAGSVVDSSTGSFGTSATDLTIQGGPLPLVLTRYYAGHSDRYGELGYRWSHSFDAFAATYANGDVAVVFGSGHEEYFAWDPSTQVYTPVDPRVTSTLTKVTVNGDLVYQHVPKHGLTTTFATNSAGDLISIRDRNGNQLTVYRSPTTGLITSVEDDAGRALTFAYDSNGRLTQVTDPAGGQVTYGYDANGDLTSVETLLEAGATPARTEYAYSRHRLVEIRQRQGDATAHQMVSVLVNTLDDVNRVIAQTDAESNSITIDYQTPGAGATRVTDTLGNATDYYFDAWARTTHLALPAGAIIQFVFDAAGELQKVIDGSNGEYQIQYNAAQNPDLLADPLGTITSIAWDNAKTLPTETIVDPGDRSQGFLNLRTTYTYDAAGNLIQMVVDPTDANQPGDELNLVTTWEYNAQGMVTKETIDPGAAPHLNLITTYTYDASGYLLTAKTIDPGTAPHLNLTWSYTYDFAGRLTTETDPNQHTTTYVYDLAGRLIERRNHLGQSIYFGHDLEGHVTSILDALGHWAFFTYDSRGLLATKTDGENNTWSYEYDDAGNLTAVTDPLNQTTTYTYDSEGRLETVTNPLNQTTVYTYTEDGLLETVTDPLQRTTVYEYDGAGRLTRQINPDLSYWEYAYDAGGRLVRTTDPTGHQTTQSYDAASRLVQTVVDAENPILPGSERNQVTVYAYDAAGRQTMVTVDPGAPPSLNLVTGYEYDAAGRVTRVIDPLNHATDYAYYPGGQIASVKDAKGQVTYYEYDAANRLTEITDPNQVVTLFGYDAAGRRTSISRGGITTTFAYDARDLLIRAVVDPNPPGQTGHLALTTTYGYDAAGRRTLETNPRQQSTAYGYDAAGRLTTITDAKGGVVTLTYDAAGQLDTVTNARGYVTDYDWDQNGNPDKITDALSAIEDYTYDALGQLTAMTDRRGVTTTYTYDGAGNLTAVSYPAVNGALAGTIAFTYDQANRRTAMVDALGTTAWTYDAAGHVLEVDGPYAGDAIAYTYDAAGRRATMTLPGNKTINYGRDARGRVTSIEDWQSQTTTMTYTGPGLLDTITRPNGITSNYDYDGAGRLTVVEHTNGATLLARYAYGLDANGNRTQAVITGTAVAAHTENYTYDELDRILSASYGPNDEVSWTYDANGNRLTQTSGGQTTTYTYNEVDWLTGTSGAFVSTGFYDAAGNRTGVCYTTGCSTPTDLFGYDWKGRTTAATVGGQAVTYAYTGDDVRATRTESGATTTYLWDREALLPLLVGDGATDRVFLEGQVLEEVAGSATSYPLTDGLGSVRLTTDAGGTAAGAVDYDVWGNLRAGTPGPLGWAGELRDGTTGLVHLRARDYSPGTGRFTSRDSLIPNAPGTQGYNPYWYANNNPATLTDPTGYCPICTPMLAGVVAAYATYQAKLALRATTELRSPAGAQKWAAESFAFVAAFFVCALMPACHQLGSPVTGGMITLLEVVKERVAGTDESIEELFEDIAKWLLSRSKPQPTPSPTPVPQPTLGPVPLPIPTPDQDTSPCKSLNNGTATPVLSEGMARGQQRGDWGRAHIAEQHSYGSVYQRGPNAGHPNNKGWFNLDQDMSLGGLTTLLITALSNNPGRQWSWNRSRCVIEVYFSNVGSTAWLLPQRKPVDRLRIVAFDSPPFEVQTMYPIDRFIEDE